MAQLPLISLLSLLLFSSLSFAETSLNCGDKEVKSQNLKKSEKVSLCTLRDDTYFISKNCQDLSCSFMKKLKSSPQSHDPTIRPGIATCRALKGEVEEVNVEKIDYPVQRCLFPSDKTFISLNLLESWDGKVFKGPSKPIDL